MLVQLIRAGTEQNPDVAGRPIAIDPSHVSAVFESSTQTNVTVVKMGDGRGFQIVGSFADVYAALGLAATRERQLSPEDGPRFDGDDFDHPTRQ